MLRRFAITTFIVLSIGAQYAAIRYVALPWLGWGSAARLPPHPSGLPWCEKYPDPSILHPPCEPEPVSLGDPTKIIAVTTGRDDYTVMLPAITHPDLMPGYVILKADWSKGKVIIHAWHMGTEADALNGRRGDTVALERQCGAVSVYPGILAVDNWQVIEETVPTRTATAPDGTQYTTCAIKGWEGKPPGQG